MNRKLPNAHKVQDPITMETAAGSSSRKSRLSVATTVALSVVTTTIVLSAIFFYLNDYVVVVMVKERGSLSSIGMSALETDSRWGIAQQRRLGKREHRRQEQGEKTEDEEDLKKERRRKRRERRKKRWMQRRKKRSNTTQESYRIVCLGNEDITYIPMQRSPSPLMGGMVGNNTNANNVRSSGNLYPGEGIIGSQILMNGNVYPSDEISVEFNSVAGSMPDHIPGSIFAQKCMATKGTASFETGTPAIEIQETMCEYNFCLPDRGCLFLTSGGPYVFNPFSSDPQSVPVVEAAIMGGTGESSRLYGGALIKTMVRSNDDSTDGQGVAVLQMDLYYQVLKSRNTPVYIDPTEDKTIDM